MVLAINPEIAAFWLKIILLTGGAVAMGMASPQESLNLALLRVSTIIFGLVMLISLVPYPDNKGLALKTHDRASL